MSAVAAAPRAVAVPATRRHRQLVAVWAVSRLYVIGAAVAIQALGIAIRPWQPGLLRHPFALLVRWDSHWYRTIASSGYLMLPGHHSDPAFFPLYPLLLHLAGLAGIHDNAAGLVISNLSLLGALLLFYELASGWLDETTALRAMTLLAVFPFSFVFSMVYPESVALLALCGAALAARQGRWGIATLAAFAAGLARPEAVVYSLPLAAEALRQRRELRGVRAGLAGAAAAAAPLGTATFVLYLWQVTGSASAWQASEQTWGRPGGLDAPWHAVTALFERPTPWLWRDAGASVVYLIGLWLAHRAGVPRAWVAAGAAVILLPVLTGSFESIGRYGLLAPAAFVGFASALRPRRAWTAAVTSSLLLGFGALVTLTAAAP